jgi:hypothetical protein
MGKAGAIPISARVKVEGGADLPSGNYETPHCPHFWRNAQLLVFGDGRLGLALCQTLPLTHPEPLSAKAVKSRVFDQAPIEQTRKHMCCFKTVALYFLRCNPASHSFAGSP